MLAGAIDHLKVKLLVHQTVPFVQLNGRVAQGESERTEPASLACRPGCGAACTASSDDALASGSASGSCAAVAAVCRSMCGVSGTLSK